MPTRLAQLFEVNRTFTPTKAAVYLKRIGENAASYFDLSDEDIVIDATNFISLSQKDNAFMFDDQISGFTGNGFLQIREFVSNSTITGYASVNYNIKTNELQEYNLYLRGYSDTGTFKASILLDGLVVNSISETVGSSWTWFSTSFIIPDPEQHIISIRLEENNNALDKIYISENSQNPTGEGPSISVSPYVNIHIQVYETKNGQPSDPLLIYDSKTTVDEIIADDWYNFNIKPISDTISVDFSSTYAIVLSATGGDENNFVIWELVDVDEYASLPSAIRV